MFLSVFTAACYGDVDTVRRHLGLKDADVVDDYGLTAMHYAAQGNHVIIMELLLKSGAKPDGASASRCTPLHRAAAAGAADQGDPP